MKIVGSELGKYHAHIASQISIDCVTQFPRCYLALKIDAGDLSFGVNARIRATGSVELDDPPAARVLMQTIGVLRRDRDQMTAGLEALNREMSKNPGVRVVSLRSTDGGPFCAGASFDELASIKDERQGKEFFLGFAQVVLAMIRCPKFIVTRVQGKTVGGGVGILERRDVGHHHPGEESTHPLDVAL